MPRIPTYQAQIPVKSGVPTIGLQPAYADTAIPQAIGQVGKAIGQVGKEFESIADMVYKREIQRREEDRKVFLLQDATEKEQQALEVGKAIDEAANPDDKINIYNTWKTSLKDALDPQRFSLENIGDDTPLKQRIKQTGGVPENEILSYQARLTNALGHFDAKYAGLIVDATQTRNVMVADAKTNTSLEALLDGTIDFDKIKADIVDAYSTTVKNPQIHIAKKIQQVTEVFLEKAFDEGRQDIINEFNKGTYNKELIGLDGDKNKINHFRDLEKLLVKAKKIDDRQAETDKKNAFIESGLQDVEIKEDMISDKYINRTLTLKDLIMNKPKNFDKLPSQVQNRWNSTAEKFTGLLESRRKESERKAEKEQKSPDARVYNDLFTRALTDWSNNNIPREAKLSESDINDFIISGEIKPKQGEKLKAVLNKSIKGANPIKIESKKRAIKDIDTAYKLGLFGDKEDIQSELEKTDTLELMDEWIEKNPDKDPTEFTKQILAPKTSKGISKIIDWALGTGKLTPEDIKARAEKQLSGKTVVERRTTKSGKTLVKYSDGSIGEE